MFYLKIPDTMKFTGLHFHMVLVIGLICVILYVFYISKDILTIDNELKNIKKQMEIIQRVLVNTGSGGGGANQVQTATPSAMKTTPYIPSETKFASVKLEKTVTQVDLEDSDSITDSDDDNISINSGKIKDILSNIQNDDELETSVPVKTETQQVNEVEDDVEDDVDGLVEDVIEDINEKNEKYDIDITPKVVNNAQLPIAELRKLCKEHGVSAKGSKEQLAERLSVAA
jgi:hypothetical protein